MEGTLLGDVHPNHHFVAKNGARIRNLSELYTSIKLMDDITFNHHVNDFKNDFHNWVRDIHKDNELANSLLEAETKKEMAECLKARIEELQTVKKEVEAKAPKVVKAPRKARKRKAPPKLVNAPIQAVEAKEEETEPEEIKEEERVPEEIKPELKEEEPKGELLSEVETVDKTIPEIGVIEAQSIIDEDKYYERPRLLRITAADFALGLIIGTIAGLIIANFI